jgi:ABC-type nitrate/sulfonate/bicarbonate transport system substrate-binding protein
MEKSGVRTPGSGVHTRHGRRHIGGVIVLASALAVVAAACSSSSSSSSTSSSSGGSTSSAAASSLTHYSVTVGNAAATYAEAPYVAASKDGALTAQNITSKSILLSSSNTLLAALVSGGVDFGVTDSFAVMSAQQKGVPVVAVCGLYQGVPGLALVVSPSLMKSLDLTPGDVNGDLKKLKGQTIGVNAPTSTGGKILTGLEVSAGLGSSWVKEVSIGSSDDVEALAHGEIAGYFEDVPIPQESAANHSGVTAFTTASVPQLSDIQYDVLATSEKFLKSNPQEVKQFLTGVAVGEKDLSAKQPAALQQISGIFNTGLPASVIDDSATTGVQTNCSMPAADWANAASVSNKFGLASGTLSSSIVTASYQDGL